MANCMSRRIFFLFNPLRDGVLIRGLACCALLLYSCALPAIASQLTILHTNDQHGHFAAFDCHPFQDIGGMAVQSTLVNTVRAEVEADGGDVLLLSAGDVNTGFPESDLLDARPDFELMKRLHYDAMVPGNHEFDNPLAVLKKQRQWAGFPFLAANVLDAASGGTVFDACLIKTFGEVRVGILGLTTARTPQMVLPENIKGLRFQDPLAAAGDWVPKLRQEVDLLRVLPFGNTIVVLELQGSEMLELLRHAAAIEPGQGGFLHAAGLSWKTQQGKPIQVMVHGSPLKPDRRYSAATNSFLAAGGDGYALLEDCPQYDTGYPDVEMLREAVAAEMPPS